jgi:integrase/recombinase XerD
MIPLAQAVDDYLAMRRALGYQLTEHGRVLPQFAAFLTQRGESLITIALALEFATQPAEASIVWWHQRLAIVRGFARYLRAFDARHEIPPANLLPATARRARPYLFSEAEIEALLEAARSMRPPLRAASCEALIGLLAVSGMRVSEACGLDRSDVELPEGRLTVRHAKNGRSREIPLHPSTVEALRRYARRRDELCAIPKDPAAFFLSGGGGRLSRHFVWKWFDELRRATGLDQETLGRRARLHDVRHSYVLRVLLGWYREGGDIEARLPLLSTVLGHVHTADTFWYFEGAPELLALACERLERTWEELATDEPTPSAQAPMPLSWERSRRRRSRQIRRGRGRR